MKIYTGPNGEKRVRVGLHEELPPEMQAENERLKAEYDAKNPTAEIDTSDIPELPDDFWENAVWVEPEPKSAVSIRLHSFVLDYFKREGRGYQSRINAVLESYVLTMMLREAEEKGRREAEPQR